jgi:hypothetical protein
MKIFTGGTTIRIPAQLGLPRARAMPIQTMINTMRLTNGIRQSRSHQPGRLAIRHIRKRFPMGTHASQLFAVPVFRAMTISAMAR